LEQKIAELAQFGVSEKIQILRLELDHLLLELVQLLLELDDLLLELVQLLLELDHLLMKPNICHDFVPNQISELHEKTPPYEGSIF
jgi:hypothetical protein